MTTSQFYGQILAALDILGALLVMVLAASTNAKMICGLGFIFGNYIDNSLGGMMTAEVKRKRVLTANQVLEIIAGHGRKFFSLHAGGGKSDEPERISHFELRNGGRLWFVDKYTQKAIYVAYRRGSWRGFSDGGTLRSLICAMADWINGKSKEFPMNHFGPWPEYVCEGDLWGYGSDMDTVREKVRELTI